MIPIPLEEPRTECCDARFIGETSRCSDCKENSEPQEYEVAPIIEKIFNLGKNKRKQKSK